MLRKDPKSSRSLQSKLVFGVKAIFVAELAFILGSYYVWRKMNRSQEFRYTVHQKFPSLLKGYYFTGEKLGNFSTRELDQRQWGIYKE